MQLSISPHIEATIAANKTANVTTPQDDSCTLASQGVTPHVVVLVISSATAGAAHQDSESKAAQLGRIRAAVEKIASRNVGGDLGGSYYQFSLEN